jgi:hypothetical protein
MQVFLQKVLEDATGRTFRSAGNTRGFPARNLPAQQGFSQQISCFRLQFSQAPLSVDISGNPPLHSIKVEQIGHEPELVEGRLQKEGTEIEQALIR